MQMLKIAVQCGVISLHIAMISLYSPNKISFTFLYFSLPE